MLDAAPAGTLAGTLASNPNAPAAALTHALGGRGLRGLEETASLVITVCSIGSGVTRSVWAICGTASDLGRGANTLWAVAMCPRSSLEPAAKALKARSASWRVRECGGVAARAL